MQKILRVGHRGAAGYGPENTLASIRQGIAHGCDYVELDIQRCRDGQLVLMHDKRVDRTTNGTGSILELSHADIMQLDAGNGERVPSLEDALSLACNQVGVILESITPGIGPEIYRAVQEAAFPGSVIYSSFLHADILAIRIIDPGAMTMALLEGVPVTMTSFAREAKATHVGLSMDSITLEFVEALQAEKLQIFVYTVNDPKVIQEATCLGVDAIISDYPDRI